MPIFEFECPECGARVERMFARAEQADAAFVYCGNTDCLMPGDEMVSHVPMRRVPSAGAFVLKGAGFHRNDYPKK